MEKIFVLKSNRNELKTRYAKIVDKVIRVVRTKNEATHLCLKDAERLIKKHQSFLFEKIHHKRAEYTQLTLFNEE